MLSGIVAAELASDDICASCCGAGGAFVPGPRVFVGALRNSSHGWPAPEKWLLICKNYDYI
jgi:hypothetical protein